MFWESKLEELQKLAPVIFTSPIRGRWVATLDADIIREVGDAVEYRPKAEGSTPAGALVELWSTIVHGSTPFTYIVGGNLTTAKRVRFNARWEEVGAAPPPPPEPELVVEEAEEPAFDPAD